MKLVRSLAWLTGAVILGTGSAVGAAELRGFVSGGFGVMLFEPCTEKTAVGKVLVLEDASPDQSLMAGVESVQKIRYERGQPLYVEFRGTVTGKTVTVQRFWSALGRVTSCEAAPAPTSNERLKASGDIPAWQFDASAKGAQLQLPGRPPVRFAAAPFAAPIAPGKSRIYDAWSQQDGGTVRLEVSEQMCSDNRSETAYGATATVRYGSQSLEGCARRF